MPSHKTFYNMILHLPLFLQLAHSATLHTAESWIPDTVESASQTGVDDVISQPWWLPLIILHVSHSPVERHFISLGLAGQFP